MHILLFGINYDPELAGIAPYTTGLAEHFARQGHQVKVITGIPHYPDWRPAKARRHEGGNPTVRRYKHFIPRRPTALGRALYELTWLASAARSMSRVKADVAIGVIPSLSGGVLAWLAARRLRIPFGVLLQDTMGAAATQSGYMGAARFAKGARFLEALICRRAKGVAIVAEGFREYLEDLGVDPRHIKRVRNWTRWNPTNESREHCRARLGWASTDFICLHAGNMGQKQALENLLDAAERLGHGRVRIVLAGGGNDRDRLVGMVEGRKLKNVSFVGVQPPGNYEAMLQAADVLLINQRASVEEMSLPSKIGSYFAAHRPIVACVSASSETAREIRLSRGAIVVPPDDPGRLAQVLHRLMKDPSERERLAANAHIFMNDNLRPEQTLPDYDAWLEALASRQNGASRALAQARPDRGGRT